MFPDAVTVDVNGPIRVRDLPLCVRTSASLAAFSLNYLRAPIDVQRRLRDLTPYHTDHTLDILVTTIEASTTDIEAHVIDCLLNTLNRATSLLLTNLTPQELSELPEPAPTTFKELHDAETATIFTESCACSIAYALRLIYLTHHRNYPTATDTSWEPNYYPPDLLDIVRNISSTAAALRLFSAITSFKTIPWFVNTALNQIELPDPQDIYRDSLLEDPAHNLIHVESESWHFDEHIDSHITALNRNQHESNAINRFAKHVTKLALKQHGLVHHKLQANEDYPFLPSHVIVGNLPPADTIFSNFTSAFPMITTPTSEQCNTTPPPHASAIAINFAMCQPFDAEFVLKSPLCVIQPTYYGTKMAFTPLPTDNINHSIDFLPNHEFKLYRVVRLLHPGDPQDILDLHPTPSHVIVFQGYPLYSHTYTQASPTESPLPQPDAHIFPLVFDGTNRPIITDEITNGPYNSVTVQILFQPQASVPVTAASVDNPDLVPTDPLDPRFAAPTSIYHIAIDPRRVPFSLAMRLIQVYTVPATNDKVYQAWALPHPDQALQGAVAQLPYLNPYCYYHQRDDHPETQFLFAAGADRADSPVPDHISGESALLALTSVPISGDLSFSFCNSCVDLTAKDSDNIVPVNKYQQVDTKSFCSSLHALLVVQTRRSSLRPTPSEPDDQPPVQNPQTATATAPTESQNQPSTSSTDEATDDDETTLRLPHPGTQTPSLATTASHQDITSDSEQETATPTTQPTTLQRISLAVSQILTPPKPTAQDQPTSSSTTSG